MLPLSPFLETDVIIHLVYVVVQLKIQALPSFALTLSLSLKFVILILDVFRQQVAAQMPKFYQRNIAYPKVTVHRKTLEVVAL